ncbi:hypothetical protein [Candidatus Nitrososphaera evergladensis]|uniref:hypothetical protein n=1 Tax=Candidatus Nitrososphaera evergladensis TaxID=1459637 RepID=UPI0011E5E21C|nr:hypothetical protein [Candidatus Nitrososphaera evergladensis]
MTDAREGTAINSSRGTFSPPASLLKDFFQAEKGELTLKIIYDPVLSGPQIAGNREPFLNAWKADPGGYIIVRTPSISPTGSYILHVTIFGAFAPSAIFSDEDTPTAILSFNGDDVRNKTVVVTNHGLNAAPAPPATDKSSKTANDSQKQGETSVIAVTKGAIIPSSNISLSKGQTTVQVPLILTYKPSVNGSSNNSGLIPFVTVEGVGACDSGNFIPASIANKMTSEQRVAILMEKSAQIDAGNLTPPTNMDHGTFLRCQFLEAQGIRIDASFAPEKVTLKPGQSATLLLSISLPKDWPSDYVNREVPVSVMLSDADNPRRTDLYIDRITVYLNPLG